MVGKIEAMEVGALHTDKPSPKQQAFELRISEQVHSFFWFP
jgi:hypothetical protein